jgi:hypothetical protein
MDTALLATKGARPTNARPGFVRGFGLRIGRRASLVPEESSSAYGVVISLPVRDVEALYAEPSVQAYRPEAVLVHLGDGTAIPALCFNLVDPPAPEDRNPEYAAKLRALAERVQLPAAYIHLIQ